MQKEAPDYRELEVTTIYPEDRDPKYAPTQFSPSVILLQPDQGQSLAQGSRHKEKSVPCLCFTSWIILGA